MNNSTLKRCTFAIISHPDAGKTTMTEKLLWFGRVIRKTGMVKSKHGNFAKSDEEKKEISISLPLVKQCTSRTIRPYEH